MIHHTALGPTPFAQLRVLVLLIRSNQITLGGNRLGKIYGRLNCRAGKRMKSVNRVFFQDESEAITAGFRPCAVCLPDAYRSWKSAQEYSS